MKTGCILVATWIAVGLAGIARGEFVLGHVFVVEAAGKLCSLQEEFGGDRIWEIDPETGEATLFAQIPEELCGFLAGLVFTPDGTRLRASSFFRDEILEFDSQGNMSVVLDVSDGTACPWGFNNMAYDAGGNFCVLNECSRTILRFPGDGGPPSVLADAEDGIVGGGSIAFASNGDLYIAHFFAHYELRRITPEGNASSFDTFGNNSPIHTVTADDSGVPDRCEPVGNDCNGNGVPDECELVGNDCNGNGVPDACDIDPADPDGDAFVSADCNGNGVPDECDEIFAPAVDYAAGDRPHSVAIGDLNGDQVLDLAVANLGHDGRGGGVSVLLGFGNGTFAAAVNYATDDGFTSVAIGDLDGNGVPDLAVTNINSNDVSVLLGVGDGTFVRAGDYAAGNAPVSVAIGDLDGDNHLDLAVTNAASNDVSVLLGSGDGTFAPAVNYATGEEIATSVAIADFNGDQVPDLAVANLGHDGRGGGVSVLLGVGDGTFAARVDYATDDALECVAIGDLNGDEVPDLALTNFNSDNVSVLLGFGDGTFGNAVHYAASGDSVAIGDLDGDQVPDLVTSRVSMLGVGDGTFAPAVNYAAGDIPVSVAIGDLDGDNQPDLAVANILSDNVSVLLNKSWRDCNENCIPDECDMDCGSSGGPCDLPDCGLSIDCNGNGVPDDCELVGNDCNGNGVPDECEPDGDADSDGDGVPDACDVCPNGNDAVDSDGDGVPDDCDICDGGDDTIDTDGDGLPDACDVCPNGNNAVDSDGDGVCDSSDSCPDGDDTVDSDGDGVPDDCDACDNNVPGDCDFVSPILASAPHDILKNRYISIDPRGENAFNLGDVPFDIRVRLSSTSVNGVTAIGASWWANAPDANCISVVGSTQPATPPNWSACSTLHLTGCPIIPTSTYDIAAVVDGMQSGPPLVAATQAKPSVKWYGDCVGFFTGTEWTAPNGQTSIDDAVAGIKTFQNPSATPGCPAPPCNATHVSVTDMVPNLPGGPQINAIVNIADVFSIILGFQGQAYPGPAIELCP